MLQTSLKSLVLFVPKGTEMQRVVTPPFMNKIGYKYLCQNHLGKGNLLM